MESDPWMLPKVTDYWDQQRAAIENGAQRLGALPTAAQSSAVAALEAAIERHVAVLDDNLAGFAAFAFADDLYKAAYAIRHWNEALQAYLAATSGSFCSLLSTRGITLNYVIDNVYEPTLFGMGLPIDAFPVWFQTAGFVYICPQAIALELMTNDGLPRDAFEEHLPRYASEGTDVAGLLATRSHEERRHFVYLDADSTPDSLAQALAMRSAPGYLVVFRDQPPLPGTTCSVWKPPGMHWPTDED